MSLHFDFPSIDWVFLQSVYGWSALQWQGWARGAIYVNSDRSVPVSLFTDSVIEYALDGKRFFGGDFYTFRKAAHVVHVTPGKHVLEVRLVRDVRAMGGVGAPTLDLAIEVQPLQEQADVIQETVLVSDVLDGWLPSPYATFDIRNNGLDWIDVDIAPASTRVRM